MGRLELDDPVVISGILLICVPSVLLLLEAQGSVPWPTEANAIADNILIDFIFLGIGAFFANFILQRVEVQRRATVSNTLCNALARLTVLAFMRIIQGDTRRKLTPDVPVLWRLYNFGGTGDATKEMDAVFTSYNDAYTNDEFQDRIWEGQLDIDLRVKRYLEDTAGIRHSLKYILISRAMGIIDDKNLINILGKYESQFNDYEANIAKYVSDENYDAVASENTLFLWYTHDLYFMLKGRRVLHRINALYGPEDPPVFWV